jgi:addiction module HigA family antidote
MSTDTIPLDPPGRILLEEFLEPAGISQRAFAKKIGLPPSRISELVHGRLAISAETALRLARFWGNSPRFWLNLQADYDLRRAQAEVGERIKADISPFAMA